ncbi:MAG: glycoside hydrolase family 43 protein [Lachnospiraceae bacterium]|nr:glycoside hydrolase family 43 protein [Lachnospiraceae bacterium]
MRYSNPIISGFHPDPSICRVGNDFYLVTSSFEYFPGLPLFHSTDLVHWEQINYILNRNSQFTLATEAPNCLGIYAPTIRYHDGVYYCVVTNVGGPSGGNFFVYTTDPYGEWSEPVRLPFSGIDPSLFFDDDGRVYYSGTDTGIFISELTLTKTTSADGSITVTCEKVGEQVYAWNGSGGNNPEGPHLYKVNGMYYLMIAEGGTEYCHMVTIARSSSVYGPYEDCPHNPILTNRSTELPIKAAGHADLVEDQNGSWWAVCLGIRPLSYPFRHNMGRETMLVPVLWKQGWPVMGANQNGHVDAEIETLLLPCTEAAYQSDFKSHYYIPGSNVTDYFNTSSMHPSWNTIYNPDDSLYDFTANGLVLHGNQYGISSSSPKSILCRRQEHFDFTAQLILSMEKIPENGEAGISIYMNNNHHYEAAMTMLNGKRALIIRRQIGRLKAIENIVDYPKETVILQLTGSREEYSFGYQSAEDTDFTALGSGEAQYLTTETGGCFTGNFIAIYASNADAVCRQFTYAAK